MEKPYHCCECDGAGRVVCPYCDQDMDCADCDGHGYDLGLLDIPRFLKKYQRFLGYGSTAWVKNGVVVGMMIADGKTRLAYRDFLLPGKKPPFDDDSRSHVHDPSQQQLFQEEPCS